MRGFVSAKKKHTCVFPHRATIRLARHSTMCALYVNCTFVAKENNYLGWDSKINNIVHAGYSELFDQEYTRTRWVLAHLVTTPSLSFTLYVITGKHTRKVYVTRTELCLRRVDAASETGTLTNLIWILSPENCHAICIKWLLDINYYIKLLFFRLLYNYYTNSSKC